LLVGDGDVAVRGDDVGLESDARGRNFGLGDGAGVLGGEREQGKQRQWSEKKTGRDGTHEILQSAWAETAK
jgi:hypothetical protein